MKTILPSLALIAATLMNGCASSRQVIVYSFLTDSGRALVPPSREQPIRCALGSGGYHEWGGASGGEQPVTLAFVDPLIRDALLINGYAGMRRGDSPELVIVFHWGCLRPELRGLPTGIADAVLNQEDMLDLVGSRALAEMDHDRATLRSALFQAAAEARYFLIVSAYAPPNSREKVTELLWRTQCSIGLAGLSQQQAFSVLAAAGAVHFGRETKVPAFVTLDVERIVGSAARNEIR